MERDLGSVQHRAGAGGGGASGLNRRDRWLGKVAGGRNAGREGTALGGLLEETVLRFLPVVIRIGRGRCTAQQQALPGAGRRSLLEQVGMLIGDVVSGQELLVLDGALALIEELLSDGGSLLLQEKLVGTGRGGGDQKMSPGALSLGKQ